MAKQRRKRVRTIRYTLLAVWLISFLLTLRFYQPEVETVRTWNRKTQRMMVRSRDLGLSKQAITTLFLAMGALIIVGSLYPISGQQSTTYSVLKKLRRRSGRGWFNVRSLACARCASTRIHRSRRRKMEWVLMLVLVRPYRCHSCMTRFRAFVPLVKLKRAAA